MAVRPQHLGAAHLEVGEEVGVVNPPLAVGLLIPHPDLHLVYVGHRSLHLTSAR